MNALIDFLAIFTNWTFNLLIFCIFLRIILSWFPIPRGRFSAFLQGLTEPLFRVFAKLPFARVGILDLTPLLTYFALEILAWALRSVFLKLGANPAIYLL